MHFNKIAGIMMVACIMTSSVLSSKSVEAHSVDDLSVGKRIETLSENEDQNTSNTVGQAVLEYNVMMDNYEEKSSGEVNYPDYYAGAYIDDAGELVVCSVSDNKNNRKKIKQE